MKRAPELMLLLAAIGLMILAILTISGCAFGVDGVRQSFTTSAKLLEASAKSFETYDFSHQEELVMGAMDKENAARAIAEWRRQRVYVIKAFSIAGATLASGIAMLPLVEAGMQSMKALSDKTVEIFQALKAVQDTLNAIKAWKPLVMPTSMRPRLRKRKYYLVAKDEIPVCVSEPCREIVLPDEVIL